MKKMVCVLVLVAIAASGAFAQFALGGSVMTDFSSTQEYIDMSYALKKLDILWGVDFGFGGGSGMTSYNFGVYGGVAPKFAITGNWGVSIPILMGINFGGSTVARSAVGVNWGFMGGVRASYALSKNWSLYTGVLLDVFGISTYISSYGGSPGVTFHAFSGAALQLGFKYTFVKAAASSGGSRPASGGSNTQRR